MIDLGQFSAFENPLTGKPRKRTKYTFHGLRKNSTNHLAELGCTPHEISAMNGMDIQTVILYTRGVNKRLLAANVADRVKSSNVLRFDAPIRKTA